MHEDRTTQMIGKWILDLVELRFGVETGHLSRTGRGSMSLTMARQIAEYLLSTRLGLTYAETARLTHHHDTTVSHNVRRVETMREDPSLNAQICSLEEAVDALRGAVR